MALKIFFLTNSGREEVRAEIKVKGKVVHIRSPALVGLFSRTEFRMIEPHEEGFVITNGERILVSHPSLKLPKRLLRVDGVEDGIKLFLPKPIEDVSQARN